MSIIEVTCVVKSIRNTRIGFLFSSDGERLDQSKTRHGSRFVAHATIRSSHMKAKLGSIA